MFAKQPTVHNNISVAPGTSALSYTAPDRTEQITEIINEVSSIAKQLSDASEQASKHNHSHASSNEINEQTGEISFRNVNVQIEPTEVHVKNIAVPCTAFASDRKSSMFAQPEPTTTFVYYSKI